MHKFQDDFAVAMGLDVTLHGKIEVGQLVAFQ